MDVVKADRKSQRKRENALQQIAVVLALTITLAGCFECRPGDHNTINGRELCPRAAR